MNRLALFALLTLTGCTAAQQTAVSTAVARNVQRIQDACAVVLPVAQSLPANVLSSLNVVVSDVQKAVVAGCGTATGIAAMARSASTVDWLATAETVLLSKGAVLPEPVKPIPVN